MVARLRTNVLKREEKGMGPISFPRLLLAGLAGIFAVFGLGRVLGFFGGCAAGFVIGGFVIFITQPVAGTPMGQFLIKAARGTVIVTAIRAGEGDRPAPVADFIVNTFNIDASEGVLDCDEIFDVQEEEDESGEVTEIVFFRDITDLDSKGLQVIENPFGS